MVSMLILTLCRDCVAGSFLRWGMGYVSIIKRRATGYDFSRLLPTQKPHELTAVWSASKSEPQISYELISHDPIASVAYTIKH